MAWVAPAPPAGHAHLIMRINGRCRVKRETPSTHSKKTHTHTHKKTKDKHRKGRPPRAFFIKKMKMRPTKTKQNKQPTQKKINGRKTRTDESVTEERFSLKKLKRFRLEISQTQSGNPVKLGTNPRFPFNARNQP